MATAGSGAVHAEHAAAMAHGVKLEFAERDLLHLAVRMVILDPVFIATEAIPRRASIGGCWSADAREFVEAPAGEFAEALEVRLKRLADAGCKVEREQIAYPAVDRIEIETRAVRRDMTGRVERGAV